MKHSVRALSSTVVAVILTVGVSATAADAAPTAHVSGASTAQTVASRTTTDTTTTVRGGDSLASIASRFGVGVGALLRANSLTLASVIHPGDTMVIPAGALVNPPAPAPVPAPVRSVGGTRAGSTAYVVRAGDGLAGIAWRHGVTLAALVTANGLTSTSVIMPGRTLTVPTATRPTPAPPAATVATRTTPTPAAVSAAPGGSIESMIAFLQTQVGVPYRFFASGPDAYDCSGLVVAAFRHIGVSVPHQSRALARLGAAVDWKSTPMRAGDLVFTSVVGDPALITHVGIALDATTWIHAVGVGRTVSIGPLPAPGRIMAVQRIAIP